MENLHDCSGCTDRNSEGTHQSHTKQHPCPKNGDPNCGYCFPESFDSLMKMPADKAKAAFERGPNTSCCEHGKKPRECEVVGCDNRIYHHQEKHCENCHFPPNWNCDCSCHQSSHSKGEEDEAWYILFDFWREYNAEKDSTKRDAIISAHTANLAKLLSEREEETAKTIGLAAASAGIAVVNLDGVADWKKAADILRAAGAEAERMRVIEQCAAIVDGWHISRGGYTELAHTLRSLLSPPHQ